jgi:hypothetical protein
VFAHPKARVLIMNPAHGQSNAHLFTQIGSHVGANMATALGARAFNLTNQYSVHDDYDVEIEIVLRWLDEAE